MSALNKDETVTSSAVKRPQFNFQWEFAHGVVFQEAGHEQGPTDQGGNLVPEAHERQQADDDKHAGQHDKDNKGGNLVLVDPTIEELLHPHPPCRMVLSCCVETFQVAASERCKTLVSKGECVFTRLGHA